MIPATVKFSIDVVIPRIIEIGLEEAPKEACGIIVPDLGYPPDQWVIPMLNRADNPLTSYKIDSQTIRHIVLDRNSEGEAVWDDILVWHTHPGGSPTPSNADYDAKIPGVKYLVVALPSGQATLF